MVLFKKMMRGIFNYLKSFGSKLVFDIEQFFSISSEYGGYCAKLHIFPGLIFYQMLCM